MGMWLDNGDKIASIVSALAGITALVLTVITHRRGQGNEQDRSGQRQPGRLRLNESRKSHTRATACFVFAAACFVLSRLVELTALAFILSIIALIFSITSTSIFWREADNSDQGNANTGSFFALWGVGSGLLAVVSGFFLALILITGLFNLFRAAFFAWW